MNRNLAAFVAGFGTGYINQDQRKEEQDRLDRLEKMRQEEHDARMKELDRTAKAQDRSDAVDEQVSNVPRQTPGEMRDMQAGDVRGMVGGSANANDANYVSDEAAQHYIKNNTGASQVASNAAAYAKMGVGDNLEGLQPVKSDGAASKLEDPATRKDVPQWKRLEQQAKVRIGSGIPQQEEIGYKALAYSQTMKSDEARKGVESAYRKEGLEGVMKFMGNWDNEDYPVTNIKLAQQGNTATFTGEINGKETTIKKYDLSKMPQGSTLDDAVLADVQRLTDPKSMFELRREQMKMTREDMQNNRQQSNADRAFDFTKERAGVEDKHWKASFDANQAQRKFENDLNSSKFSYDKQKDADKANAGGGADPEQFRQNFNAAISAFDKSFKRDALGNITGDELDSKLYSQAANVIGKEIMAGADISTAQGLGRRAYDEAKSAGVSVESAYKALKANGNVATPAGSNAGASAVRAFMTK